VFTAVGEGLGGGTSSLMRHGQGTMKVGGGTVVVWAVDMVERGGLGKLQC